MKNTISQNSGQKLLNNKTILIGAITLVFVLVLLAAVIYLPKGQTTAGKAVHVVETASTGLQLYINFNQVTAAKASADGSYPADVVPIDIMFNTAEAITHAQFKLEFGNGLESASSGGKYLIPSNGFSVVTNDIQPIVSDVTVIDLMNPSGKSGNMKMVTLYLKVSDSATVDNSITVKINEILLEGVNAQNNGFTITSNIDHAATIIPVPGCQDADKDGYGKQNTDLRGCPQKGPQNGLTDFDCNDNAPKINPKAAEICDGIDNDCSVQTTEEQLVGANNDITKGVCWGTQICMGADGWRNSYEVTDKAKNLIMFGTNSQVDLYTANADTCDFYDNDCDGLINEDDLNCKIGGGISKVGTIGSKVPGNVFVDYVPNGNSHADPQKLTTYDQYLFPIFFNPIACGNVNEVPCDTDLTDAYHVWLCRDGVYYLQKQTGLNGQGLSGEITKFSPVEDKSIVLNVPEKC